jgi:type IV pilus assembly protein PilB
MGVLSEDNQQRVKDELVKSQLMSDDVLHESEAKARELKKPFFQYLIDTKIVPDEELKRITAKVLNVPYVNLMTAQIPNETLKLLSKEIAERYMAVPLGEMKGRLVVAMLDADNVQAADFLSNKIGRPISVYMASEEGIKHIISQYGANLDGIDEVAAVEAAAAKIEDSAIQDEQDKKDSKSKKKDIKTIVEDSPISKTLNAILEYAVKNRASDIHMEPIKTELKIRARVDGVLREIMRLPKSTEPAMVSRIKILSNLKIDEHRIPQDGQFAVQVGDKEVDLRISISPIVWGEQVVIRILDKTGTSLKLEDMGYVGHALKTIRKGIAQPNGMVLTSGPTGSGKSTSMYALLQEILDDSINIVTLEDPVEYKIEGVNQIQVNADVGLTFSNGLRSILRQDPDVVMVGEIRDAETATLAVQAALTGHLVFSTLHTNSAAGVLPRLLDMGIEPFLIASTVNTVIGQRLVRRNAESKLPYQSTPAETAAIHETIGHILPQTKEQVKQVANNLGYQTLPLANQNAYTLFKGKDTKSTPGGYKGRLGLYEVMDVSEQIEELILRRATSSEIQKKAQEQGTVTMREDGYLKALSGLTTIEEVNRVAALDGA